MNKNTCKRAWRLIDENNGDVDAAYKKALGNARGACSGPATFYWRSVAMIIAMIANRRAKKV